MSRVTKNNLKTIFVDGGVPTQTDFANFIDTTVLPVMGIVVDASGNIATDASLADIFRIIIAEPVILLNPTNVIDGQMITWWISQDAIGNRAITLDAKFSVIAALPWSTSPNTMDMMTVRYDASADLFRVVSFIPGYVSGHHGVCTNGDQGPCTQCDEGICTGGCDQCDGG